MLQLFIMFTMAGMIAVGSLVIVATVEGQSRVQDIKEVNRRIDIAAAGIDASLTPVPSLPDVWPVTFIISPVNGIPTIQTSIAIGTTPWGTPFRYCPMGSSIDTSGQPGSTLASVDTGNGTYTVTVRNNIVVGDNVVASGSAMTNLAALRSNNIVAVLTAPIKEGNLAPSCNSVTMNGNTAVVPGGIVRVIYNTGQKARSNQTAYYVANTASGDGTGKDSTNVAQIDAALLDIVDKRTKNVVFNISTAVSPGSAAWNSFQSSLTPDQTITIKGAGAGNPFTIPTINLNTTQSVSLIGKWRVFNNEFRNARFVIQKGSGLYLASADSFYEPTDGYKGSEITVNEGGQLTSNYVNILFYVQSNNGALITNYGKTQLIGGSGQFLSGQPDYDIVNYGYLTLNNFGVGVNGATALRATLGGITQNSINARIYGDVSTSTPRVAAALNGQCWTDVLPTIAFKWANSNGIGATSSVRPESDYNTSGVAGAGITSTRAEGDERIVAREHNLGSITCI